MDLLFCAGWNVVFGNKISLFPWHRGQQEAKLMPCIQGMNTMRVRVASLLHGLLAICRWFCWRMCPDTRFCVIISRPKLFCLLRTWVFKTPPTPSSQEIFKYLHNLVIFSQDYACKLFERLKIFSVKYFSQNE